MNILKWLRTHCRSLLVSPASDPSEYSLDYGDGVISISWQVGDELYHVDVNMKDFTVTAITNHERYPDVSVRTVTLGFTMVFLT